MNSEHLRSMTSMHWATLGVLIIGFLSAPVISSSHAGTPNSYLIGFEHSPHARVTAQSQQVITLGNLGLGIAAHDTREGTGYIMYSEESVHTRFVDTPPSQDAADHLIAVVFEGGQWKIDRNKSALVSFTPRASDRLLAEVDFSADEVVMLIGQNSVIEGINAGYDSGDLLITAEMWGNSPNVGEFGVSGTEFIFSEATLINLAQGKPVSQSSTDHGGNPERAVDGNTSGNYTGNSVTHTRNESQAWWEVDLGKVYQLENVEIWNRTDCCSERLTDFHVLVSDVSFTSQDLNTTIAQAGVSDYHFPGTPGTTTTFELNRTGRYLRVQLSGTGSEILSLAEVVVNGTELSLPEVTSLTLGELNGGGVVGTDSRTGTGYIMYSEESVHARFSANAPNADNADHLIAVINENGTWKYDNNDGSVTFDPLSSDRLLAEVDFSNDTATLLQGQLTSINGINAGYLSGDLLITPNIWPVLPSASEGEFGVSGTVVFLTTEGDNADAELVNIAQDKPVSQSSTDHGGNPERAVDGNTSGNYAGNSVTHTRNESQAWWEVDLEGIYQLENVEIWNRTNCCFERLSNFHVLVSDVPFASQNLTTTIAQAGVSDYHFPETPGARTTIELNRTGRYLRVQLSGSEILSLAEVVVNVQPGLQVFPMADQEGTVDEDVSLFVSAYDTDNNVLSYSATGLPPGLSIDGLSGEIFGTLAEVSAGTYAVSVSVSNGVTGLDTQFSWTVSEPNSENVAQGKPVSQSSTSATWGGAAERAVDGNTSGHFGENSVTHTEDQAQPWWEVDLEEVFNLENVEIWNRTDCCSERLADFHVLVSDDPFTSQDLNATIAQAGVSDYHFPGTPGTTTTFELNRTGRYLRVQLSGTGSKVLSLAEVVVNGAKRLDLKPLSALPIPGPDNLHAFDSNLSSKINGEKVSYSEFVIDEEALVQLGKSLFWDMQVGSDGVQACASCHFASGIDPRAKNQLNPGPDNAFQIGSGVNYTLVADDFPFHEKADPADRHSAVLRDTDDISSSQGIINSVFQGINEGSNIDLFTTPDDPIFNLSTSSAGVVNTRRVEPRNTPTSVNAVFNFLQFWDGRANNNFNGVTPFGNRDKNAKIVRMDGSAEPVQILMPLSSLASQAVGPPLSHFEMSAAGRPWPEIGKKLLADGILPLAGQLVDENDSHLGSLSNQHNSSGATGLNISYADLIRQAFNEKWTGASASASPVITFSEAAGGTLVPSVKSQDGFPATDSEYTLMEANFSFFFGLALQAYQAELVSDDTPFDRFVEGDNEAISSSAKNGLDIFLSECASCHRGPTFSNATVSEIFSGLSNPDEVANHGIIERMPTALELAAATVFFSTGEKPYMPGVAQLDLNFDPQGKSVEVVAAGTNDVYFEGTLSDSSPSCSKHSTSLSLSTTSTSGLSNFKGATADGEFQVFDNCGTSFRVTVESAPAGSYDVRVDGVNRGTLEVLPPAVYDQGFYNIAVRPTGEDIGIGGTDPFGNPLSFSEMELLSPGRDDIREGLPGGGLGDGFEFDPPVGSLGEKSDAPGAFKTPILRNIALTAPYMHNGGMSTLRQVVEFYNRGGDFADENLDVLDPDIEALYLSESEIDDVVAFMETLTDERVVNQSAPFDHPELLYPEGHSAIDGITIFNVAVAVGANGGVPIRQFLDGETAGTSAISADALATANEYDEQPGEYALEQNYPNPFNPSTTIRFSLAKPINVTLEIYNMLGQRVKTLVNSELGAGFHSVTWDGRNNAGESVASGVYLYRIKTPNFVQSRKMTFQK